MKRPVLLLHVLRLVAAQVRPMSLEVSQDLILHELDAGVADPAEEPLPADLNVGEGLLVGFGAHPVAGHDVAHETLLAVGGLAANAALVQAKVPL